MNNISDDSKTTAEIIQFPNSSAATAGLSPESQLLNILDNPQAEQRLKNIMEAAVFDAWIRTRYQDVGQIDDPFDAIYISELKPDRISQMDVTNIVEHSQIIDLSDTIHFSDEWED